MTKHSSVLRRRWLFLAVGLIVLALAVAMPLAVFALGTGGVGIKVNAVNLTTADGPSDDGSVGDELKVRVKNPTGTSFSTVTGKAVYTSAGALPSKTYNIDKSTIGLGTFGAGSTDAGVGCIRLEDTSQPGDHIDICLLVGKIEVFITFAGFPTNTVRWTSGQDQLNLKAGAK